MFKFDNAHIFTGYLKQLLSSFNLPTCRLYTREFADYFSRYGHEDPRVIESFDTITYTNTTNNKQRNCVARKVNYLKGNELYNYFWNYSQDARDLGHKNAYWRRGKPLFYDSSKSIPGLTKVLNSPGNVYDVPTHEHLGEYLRFMRDYYGVNLMSLYNCFNNKICNNIYYKHEIKTVPKTAEQLNDATATAYSVQMDQQSTEGASITIKNLKNIDNNEIDTNNAAYERTYSTFNSQDPNYRIYALPVKLFCDYTIAIDCSHDMELFCGLYTTTLDTSSDVGASLITRTYKKVNRAFFNKPFLYDSLNVKYWNFINESMLDQEGCPKFISGTTATRWDIALREQDLKLFIKIPASCKSSITILEGDFRGFNDTSYTQSTYTNANGLTDVVWEYKQNHAVVNFGDTEDRAAGQDINSSQFRPIGKLQLLAFNTGESYPFADRLVEYLCGSTITPIDEIPDNIKRAQKVMSQNHHYFKIDGLWENKMQKIIYDYMTSSGPIEVDKATEELKLIDKRHGTHKRLGHTSRSTLYDALGYVDKEAEKWYASWRIENGTASVHNTIQNVDIYNGLYDI